MLREITLTWAVLGAVLTTATQLRSSGSALPIGPGELVLFGWILFVVFIILRGVTFVPGRVFQAMFIFWTTAFILLGFGVLVAVSSDVFRPRGLRHDGLALGFTAIVSCLLSLRMLDGDSDDYHLRLARLTFFTLASCAIALLAVATVTPILGPIRFWYGGVRFSGWAENPNQMALLTVGLPFLGCYLLQRAEGFWRKALYGLAIGGCVWVGLATKSDALRVGWTAAACGVGVLAWYRMILRRRGAMMYLSHLAVPIAVVSLSYAFGGEMVERLQQMSQAMYEEGDQGSVRLQLWSHGLEAMARSPLVGFGPGAYSGLHRPFESFEAHNSFIDWGMSTGALGVLLYLGLLVWIAWRAASANSLALLGLVAALAAFSAFNYVLRHPTYWLFLVLTLALTERQSRRHAGVRVPMPAIAEDLAFGRAGRPR